VKKGSFLQKKDYNDSHKNRELLHGKNPKYKCTNKREILFSIYKMMIILK